MPETFARSTRIGLYIIEAIDESLTSKQEQIQQKRIARKKNRHFSEGKWPLNNQKWQEKQDKVATQIIKNGEFKNGTLKNELNGTLKNELDGTLKNTKDCCILLRKKLKGIAGFMPDAFTDLAETHETSEKRKREFQA